MSDQKNEQQERSLSAPIEGNIDPEIKLLAAIAYGEASVQDEPEEVLGIAYAVCNRARAWGKTVSGMLKADSHYTYAADGTNKRFNLLLSSSAVAINKSIPMRTAVNAAINAQNEKGHDPSNGAFWWDGVDLKEKRSKNPRISRGFKYGAQEHNIYQMEPILKVGIRYWQVQNTKTKKLVDSAERGRFDTVYVSTAARGQTIFWRYNPDFVKATGTKDYK
ncbi:hypothetical protein Q4S45_10855 [Massilia sp. R2A-15]|uniref:hypothetical protein n=1 Tax=Massilia sp. R2A-15 TaxID=3064278 RepID=UPI002735F950|nr:hypothetical protein [Massilia sp. R2A-15]WLI91590.1 hypothetical protein Q4S45_10855 [Massilia sp. R2A-15]